MTSIKEEKDFDCLKMKAEIQAKNYEKTKDMTTEELLAYYRVPLEESPIKHIRTK